MPHTHICISYTHAHRLLDPVQENCSRIGLHGQTASTMPIVPIEMLSARYKTGITMIWPVVRSKQFNNEKVAKTQAFPGLWLPVWLDSKSIVFAGIRNHSWFNKKNRTKIGWMVCKRMHTNETCPKFFFDRQSTYKPRFARPIILRVELNLNC